MCPLRGERRNLFTIFPETYGDGFLDVDAIGDVDGDGRSDFVVGVNRFLGKGYVQVISGVDGALLYQINGLHALDGFGSSVAGVEDMDGDAMPDFIVGSLTDLAVAYSGVDGSLIHAWVHDDQSDFGVDVQGVGDLNGDGRSEVIIGAPDDVYQGMASGTARVYSGLDGSELFVLAGCMEGERFGSSVDGAGDVNGDGTLDLVVAADLAMQNGDGSGQVTIFSGETQRVLYRFEGATQWDRFGSAISGGEDVNGDGLADLLVAAVGDDSVEDVAGTATVFAGNDFYLDINPTTVEVGDTVTLGMAEADPGSFINLWTASIDGTPIFVRVLRSPSDGDGAIEFTADITPDLAGLSIELWAFAIHDSDLVVSAFERLEIEE